jgi:hypothetical protein
VCFSSSRILYSLIDLSSEDTMLIYSHTDRPS